MRSLSAVAQAPLADFGRVFEATEGDRPRATLSRVLDALGTTLLSVAHGEPAGATQIDGVVIYDPVDEPDLPRGAIVLGVSALGDESIAAALHDLGTRGASALVVRAPVSDNEVLAKAANRSGVAVLGLTPGASWTRLVVMLRTVLASDAVEQIDQRATDVVERGDLFTVANAVSVLLGAPITIEDRSSRVLAFSGRQDEADSQWVASVLDRQVPRQTTQRYLQQGVFKQVYQADTPVWVDSQQAGPDQLPRVAIAVRAGDEILGSIWALLPVRPTAEQSRALTEGANVAALHLMRLRNGLDVDRQAQSDLVRAALDGGAEARQAMTRLGLSDQRVVLLGLEVLERAVDGSNLTDAASIEAERQHLSDAFALHLRSLDRRSACAVVGGVTYGLMPSTREGIEAEQRAVEIVDEFLARTRRFRAVAGIGPVARTPAELVSSRATVSRVLRVLRGGGGEGRRAATLPQVQLEELLLDLGDLAAARGDRANGPVAELIAYDSTHKSMLFDSISAWFDAFGDVAAAASSLSVHPNTLRYRLNRISTICDLDLADPDTRLGLMVQLRMARFCSD
ncbi:PucR family transcriptional regulator [Kribbella sp. NPDC051620]|uniref:PucR family transcriptional regulator n=1 Tax=Kribbella sp. NPDC051620 TaxID=3364120 RepID=UPI0037B6B316